MGAEEREKERGKNKRGEREGKERMRLSLKYQFLSWAVPKGKAFGFIKKIQMPLLF